MNDIPEVTKLTDCGRCHECGEDLCEISGSDWQWCPGCLEAKLYDSHMSVKDASCPYVEIIYTNRAGKRICTERRLQDA